MNDGFDPVQRMRDEAAPWEPPAPTEPEPSDPDPEDAEDLPEGCPVVPLGISGTRRFYIDAERQLVALDAREHGRLQLMALFGRYTDFLERTWPRYNKDGEIVGWRPELAAETLMGAAARRGIWDPNERERGRGAWRGEDGELVLHCGDRVLIFPPDGPNPWARARSAAPGLVGRYVYAAGPAMPLPASERADAGESGPAAIALQLLKSWNWRRGELDAVLLLGWIGAAMIGGALDWRPLVWITGGAGVGKSTLHIVLRHLLGEAVVQVSDASAAGIWQKIRHDTLPVAFDELEAEEDNRKAANVVKLARQAASGGLVLRGGADHHGAEFKARSAFFFSSILRPPLLGQDLSRMALLDLLPLGGAPPPDLEPKRWRAIGAQLRRRLVDGWPRWNRTLEFFRASLAAVGHTARGADQFGTLLATADVLLHDGDPCADIAAGWIEKLKAEELAEAEDLQTDEKRWLQHLLTTPVDAYRSGQRWTLAHWIRQAAELGATTSAEALEANKVIGTFGLKVVRDKATREQYLAVANYHQGLAQLHAQTHWAGRSGTMGVWVQAARRLEGAIASKKNVWIGGAAGKVTLLPLSTVFPADVSAGAKTSAPSQTATADFQLEAPEDV